MIRIQARASYHNGSSGPWASMGGGSFRSGMLVLVVGLLMLLIGFFRGESKS
jgi:hypothetical protein